MMPNDNWITPPHILDRVTKVLGDGWFDPCPSNPTFNGLEVKWGSRCFINPPYSRKLFKQFVLKGAAEWDRMVMECQESYEIDEKGFQSFVKKPYPKFIWLVNYGNSENRRPLRENAMALCDMNKRINFIHPEGDTTKDSNRYDQMFYYWWRNSGYKSDSYEFSQSFSDIGEVFVK